MAKKDNLEYWQKRALKHEARSAAKGDALAKKLKREYEKAAKAIREKIDAFYGRYASENGLSYAEAVKRLNSKEAREWKKTLGEYVEEINAIEDKKIKARLIAELDARSYASQQDRLSSLQAQIDMEVDRLFSTGEHQMTMTMTDVFTDGYYHKAFDLQQRAGVISEFARLSPNLVEDVLTYPWSGADFSTRLWENKRALLFSLRQEMTQGIIQGLSVAAMSKGLADTLGKSYTVAERLIRTEANHFHNEADKAAYEAAGVEEYEFMATLDNRTSAICGSLDGKHFPLSEAKPGVNYPPMHPHCRSTTIEYDPDDAADWAASGQPMPKNMTYEEWAKEQGINSDSDELLERGKSGKIKKNIEFTPAATIQEADAYAKNVLGVTTVSYKGVDIQTANEWNRGLADSFGRFPELRKGFGFVGEAHERNAALKPVAREHYLDNLVKLNPSFSKEQLEPYADKQTAKLIRQLSVGKDTYAQSWSPTNAPFNAFSGVTVNREHGKDSAKFIANLAKDVKSKFHPIGCDTIRSVLDHEIGHQLDKLLRIGELPEVQRIFDSRTKDQITESLSRYAWKNRNSNRYSEMIAEAWAEYCNNTEPREIAKQIGETIEREYMKKFGGA